MSVTIRELPTLSPLQASYLFELDNADTISPLSGKTSLGAISDFVISNIQEITITGTLDQINVSEGPDFVISIPENPIFPGNATAGSFNSTGLGDTPGSGNIDVTNGNPVVNGHGTFFFEDLGQNSSITIDGVYYTVQQVITNETLILTESYAGVDATGIPYFIDASFFSMTTSDGTHIGAFTNSGKFIYDSLEFVSFAPAFYATSFGSSVFDFQADSFMFNIDASGQFYLGANNQNIFSIQGNGDILAIGNFTLGMGSTSGQTFYIPTNTFDTYSPFFNASNDGSFSALNFYADTFVFNPASGKTLTVAGGVEVDNGLRVNQSGAPNQYAFDVYDAIVGDNALYCDTLNHHFGVIGTDYIVYGSPGSGYPELFKVIAQDGVGVGRVTAGNNLLNTNSSDPTAAFMGDLSAWNGNIIFSQDGSSNPVIKSFADVESIKFTQQETFDGIPAPSSIWDIITFNSIGTDTNGNYKGVVFRSFNGTSDWYVAQGVYYIGGGEFVAQDGAIFFDIPNDGLLQFGDNVSVLLSLGIGNIASGNYGLQIFNTQRPSAIGLESTSDIPVTYADGGVIFTQMDEGLEHTLLFFKDSAGNVTQLGEGSGGGGTVTLISVTSDLTVDGIPSGSFTVDGEIGLAPTGVSAGFYDIAGVQVDINGRITDISQRGSYDSVNNNLFLNGTGLSAFTSVTQTTLLGDGADVTDNSTASAVALGASAKAGVESVSIGLNAGAGTNGHTGAFFLGPNTDATINNLFNIAAIGYGSQVSRQKTMSYGNGDVSHIFGGTFADSTLHIKSNATSGLLGAKGVLRLNGINDSDNSWPVSDFYFEQNALQMNALVTETLLTAPISNALGGCTTVIEFKIGVRSADGAAGGYVIGKTAVGFDGGSDYYFIGGGTGPVPVVFDAIDSAIALAGINLVLVSGGGVTNLEIQVVGVNDYTLNWNGMAQVLLTQATIDA